VVNATCRYRAPARYDDEILIETKPTMLRGTVLKFAYRVYRKPSNEGQERELLAEGETVHVACDDKLNRMPLPEKYIAALKAMMAEV
jgi:acyl-CoA thioester hydrolase